MTTNALNTFCAQWLELADEAIAVDSVTNILGNVPDDPWVVAAAADKCVDNVDVQRALLNLGLERAAPAMERSRKAMMSVSAPVEEEDEEEGRAPVESEAKLQHDSLVAHFSMHQTDELLCRLRTVLLARLDKLETYVDLSRQWAKQKETPSDEPVDGWDDLDPWNEEQDENTRRNDFPLPLSIFLRGSLLQTALFLASNTQFDALSTLFERHAMSLNPHRLYILQNIPEHSHPSDFRSLLPAIDLTTDAAAISVGNPWRNSQDWTEKEEVKTTFLRGYESSSDDSSSSFAAPTVSEVSQWYRDRIYQTDDAGLVDIAFALVQHGASQSVPDLDEIGEELGLLSRLVYDAPGPANDTVDDNWTLLRWKSLSPLEVIQAYLAYSRPESIANDIRHLVMPYLFVLEAREERAGRKDPTLVDRLFREYLLQAPLELAAAIFDASKPTLSPSERLIKKDEDMARLALAYLYGSDSLTDWPVMSRIFECLPEWSGVDKEEGDEADTTLLSLGDFVTPSTARPRCTPTDLLIFFSPLSASSLSRVLDVLDVHLESGEILARWNVPAPLRWFLQSADNGAQQRAWATRMARRAGSGGEEPESEDDWLELLDDMLKLVGGGEGALRGAFGLLSKEEVTRIFFGGLLSSGNFAVAKSVLRKSRTTYLSDPSVVEDQVLASSREFYDNADSGNLHQGDMKLAYDCLTVAAPSSAIQREREFIEATSRICSFNVVSRPGIPISPIEIRLVKDRLSLVARVLSSTEDAYKHSKVILDLVNKLGYRDDVAAEVKALAMLADAALQSEDFISAAETSERMIEIVRKLTGSSASTPDVTEKQREAVEVCWHSCFQLGRQSEFHDVGKKLSLLGHALELCPPEHMLDVLSVWRKVEGEVLHARQEELASHRQNAASRKRRVPSSTAASLRARLQDLQLGSPGLSTQDAAAAAALASRTLKSVAANFPFSVRGRQSEQTRRSIDGESHRDRSSGPDVSAHARQALSRGIGWLIGADDQ